LTLEAIKRKINKRECVIRREEKAKNKRKEGYEKDMFVGEAFGFSKLSILSEGPPLFLFDMLLTTRNGSRT
jgi:hypothetical protein